MKSYSQKKISSALILLIAVICLSVVCGPAARATTYYWNTTGTNTWSDTTKWSNNATSGGTTGTVPLSTDYAYFNQLSVNGTTAIQLGTSTSILGMTFANIGPTLIDALASGTQALTLGNGGITINGGSGPVTIGNPTNGVGIALSDNQTWTNNSSNLLTIVNTIEVGAGVTSYGLTFSGNGHTYISGSIDDLAGSGAGSITKNGNGTLTLAGDNGNNAFAVPNIYLNAGVLKATTSAYALGGSLLYPTRLTLSGGILQLTYSTATNLVDNTVVSGNVLVLSDRGVAGAGVIDSFGTLSLSGTLLNFNNAFTSSGVSGLTYGAATLTGNSTLLSLNYGAGNNLITLASIDGSGTNANLVVGGNGNVTITGTTNLGSGNLSKFNNGVLTLGGPLLTAGTVALNQEPTGNVILGGTTSAQNISANGGTLTLGNSAAASAAPIVGSSATLTLAGATLMMSQLTTSGTDKIGTLNLGPGSSKIAGQAATGGGGTVTVSFGSLGTVATGATVNFSAASGANGATQFGTAPTLVNGIIGGWATFGGDFATMSGSNVAAYAGYASGTNTDFSGAGAAVNVKETISSGSTVLLASSGTINSLNLASTTGNTTLNLGGNTLTLNSGGILNNSNNTVLNVINGVLTSGTTSAPSELVFTQYAGTNLNLGATIADNAAGGSVSFVLNPGGTAIRLSGVNTYTGNTYLNTGATVTILTDRQFGAAPSGPGASQLFLNNGANLTSMWQLPAALSSGRGITLSGSETLTGGGGVTMFAMPISGVGALTFTAGGGLSNGSGTVLIRACPGLIGQDL